MIEQALDKKPIDLEKMVEHFFYMLKWEDEFMGCAFRITDNLLVTANHCVDKGKPIKLTGFSRKGCYQVSAIPVALQIKKKVYIVKEKGIEVKDNDCFADLAILKAMELPKRKKKIRFANVGMCQEVFIPMFIVSQGVWMLSCNKGFISFLSATNIIATTAILYGTSGSPILDRKGRVVGIVTHLLNPLNQTFGATAQEILRFKEFCNF